MKKIFLMLFILVDLSLMGATGYYLYLHLTHQPVPGMPMSRLMNGSPMAISKSGGTALPVGTVKPSTSTAPGGTPTTTSLITPLPSSVAGTPAETHNIGFRYNNPKAHSVAIRGDFTGWKAEPMKKGPSGVWTYAAPLTPGEWAYCFTVDEKTFRDPGNARTKKIGATLVSSVVVKSTKTPVASKPNAIP